MKMSDSQSRPTNSKVLCRIFFPPSYYSDLRVYQTHARGTLSFVNVFDLNAVQAPEFRLNF